MSATSLTSVAQSNNLNGSVQAALQQAKRTANQAEATAQTLAAQAANAQAEATNAQDYASALTIQAGQAQLSVGWTQQNLAEIETAGQLNTQISSVVKNVVDASPPAQPSIVVAAKPTPPVIQPVVNTQGQITGKIINTSA
jgi:F0F1-type ATP synthase delta subunit